MILRRIAQGIKDQDWFVVSVEIIIVVIGIFIGMQVTDWNDDRKSAAIADAYLDRILIDVEAVTLNTEKTLAYYTEALRNAELAMAAYNGPASALDEKFLIHLYQASQELNLRPVRGAYDELVQAGEIILFVDTDLRTRLSNFYGRQVGLIRVLDSPTDYREEVRKRMRATTQKLVRENCGDQYGETDDGQLYVFLQQACSINLPDEVAREEALTLYADETLKGELAFHISDLNSKVNALANNEGLTDKLLEALREVNT